MVLPGQGLPAGGASADAVGVVAATTRAATPIDTVIRVATAKAPTRPNTCGTPLSFPSQPRSRVDAWDIAHSERSASSSPNRTRRASLKISSRTSGPPQLRLSAPGREGRKVVRRTATYPSGASPALGSALLALLCPVAVWVEADEVVVRCGQPKSFSLRNVPEHCLLGGEQAGAQNIGCN